MNIEDVYAGQRAILETWAIHEVTPYKCREPFDYPYSYVENLRDRLKQMRNGDLSGYEAHREA